MQAITTKYLCATNFKGSRIKASCERGSITISYPHELTGDDCHIAAANELVDKFIKEDKARYGSKFNPWSQARVCGTIANGVCVHVFLPVNTYKCAFYGRQVGAIGKQTKFSGVEVAATSPGEALIRIYDRYEHIHGFHAKAA